MAQKTLQALTCWGKPIPLVIKGKKVNGVSTVTFTQECCKCGLKHLVVVEHDGNTPDITARFSELEETKDEKQ